MISLLCKFAVLVVVAVQAFALCHIDAGRVCEAVADATVAACQYSTAKTDLITNCPSCTSGESESVKSCDRHALPDGRHTIVPPAAFLPIVLMGFDPTEFRAHAMPAFNAMPPLPPSARLSLPLLI